MPVVGVARVRASDASASSGRWRGQPGHAAIGRVLGATTADALLADP